MHDNDNALDLGLGKLTIGGIERRVIDQSHIAIFLVYNVGEGKLSTTNVVRERVCSDLDEFSGKLLRSHSTETGEEEKAEVDKRGQHVCYARYLDEGTSRGGL